MKCKNEVITEERRAKGSGLPIRKVVLFMTPHHRKQGQTFPVELEGKQEICGGEIEVDVELESSGGCSHCGGSDIVVKYRCKRCGGTHYPELPQNSSDLEHSLADQIAAMTDEEHQKLVELRERVTAANEAFFEQARAKLHPKLK